ncbi:MAG: AAA family ATPase [Oscillatoriales cyanobacterium SM2_2_1]|nr:AAA family ATPase [Oscillatoriales cyanobacterium SM2_2_1]
MGTERGLGRLCQWELNVTGIGFCGAHRTGKTTLAAEVSTYLGVPFVRTSTSLVFRRAGLDPADPLTIAQRLDIQQQVLTTAIAQWQPMGSSLFVSDRTPVDMGAYLLADIQGQTEVEADAVTQYVTTVVAATNDYFRHLFLIPPAIPLVLEAGKAALNSAYMLHLHYLILGLCGERQLRDRVHVLPLELTDLGQRRDWVTAWLAKLG